MSRAPGLQPPLERQQSSRLSLAVCASAGAAAEVRRALASTSNGLLARLGQDGLLLVTELVNNAVMHGSKRPANQVSVEVRESDTTIRVEVRDDGAGFTWRRPPGDDDRIAGYGLVLVDAVAERWGIDTSTGRTCVWFEL